MIKRKSLSDEVTSRLKLEIVEGQYKLGDKLPTEPELMDYFGVGRSTIREAIRSLSNSGWVRVQQGLGTFVKNNKVNTETLSDRLLRVKGLELNEVRELIELKIAEKAAMNRSDDDILQMRSYLAKRNEMALAHNALDCIQADINFHLCIAKAAKSEILLDLYSMVAEYLQSYFIQLYIDTESFIATQSLHESLLQSIIEKDPSKAWEWAAKITNQPN